MPGGISYNWGPRFHLSVGKLSFLINTSTRLPAESVATASQKVPKGAGNRGKNATETLPFGAVHDVTAQNQGGALQSAIFNSANFSSIATDAKGVIQIFNVGAERMLGYSAAEVMNKITPADISDPEEVIERAKALTAELGTTITPGFEALVFKASRGIEDIYELTYIRKDGSRFPAVVSVTALRDSQKGIIGYLLIGTDNTARKQAEAALAKAGALQSAIFNSANFSSIATDAKGVIQIFNVGAERMLGYSAAEVMNKITPADISDPEEVIERAKALTAELGTTITPGFEALVFKASRGIEDIYELTYIRKDGSRFPAVVSVTALRDAQKGIIGYLLIGTDNTERKQAEAALAKAGALQSAIFNSANFSSIATDANGVIQIFNVGAERMLGYSAAEVMNKITPADISDPKEVIERAKALTAELGTTITPGFEALVFKALRGIEDIYELTYIRKDGSRFPAVVSVTALRDSQKGIIGYLLIGTDNTARKQAEAALAKAGALQSAIFNSANFSSIATDAKGVIQIFNVGAERMLGYSAAEVMNKVTPADISDPEEVVERAKALTAELGTTITPGFEALVFKASRGIEDIYELTYIRKDGSRFPAVVSVTALRDGQGEIIGYLLIGTDNTARMLIEEERMKLDQRLRDQQFYTRSLIESNIDALMTTDSLGIITDVNNQMEALTGCTRDELIGAPFKNCFTDPARAIAGIKRVLNERKVSDYELTARSRNGIETLVSYNASTFYDRERKLQGVFAAARDITEKRSAEIAMRHLHEGLTRANAELDQAGRLKDEFLANMSHELRTPLNAILGLSEALLEQLGGSLNPRQVRSVTTIASSGAHLLTLIHDILDLSKVESGKLELNPELVDVREFCESCLLFVRTQAMQKDIGVEFHNDDHLEKIVADPKRLKQILVNLLTNAVKFTPDGGKIGLKLNAPADEDVVVFTVWDTGIGIAPENERQLFRAFSQIDSGLTRAQEGTGLGLVLVAKLVELHGGSVALKSSLGKGSRFIVKLPQTTVIAPQQVSTSTSEPDRTQCRRALVIEDDPTSGGILVKYLTELGLDSVVHLRGDLSVEAVLRERPDVILLDIQLPGDSGWVVLGRLKEHPETRNIPVAVVSVVDEPGRARTLGAAAHFTKPITRAQLAGFLQREVITPLPSATPPTAPSSSMGPSIMLAEDNEANVQTIGGYLEEKGYAMHYAANGEIAVELARQLRPALILMDIQMPVMDGLAAIREIRADRAMAAVPIVALTALAMAGDRDKCLEAGATDYMSKPMSLKALGALVARLLPKKAGGG
jgi:PAS domain S-box-containing protein